MLRTGCPHDLMMSLCPEGQGDFPLGLRVTKTQIWHLLPTIEALGAGDSSPPTSCSGIPCSRCSRQTRTPGFKLLLLPVPRPGSHVASTPLESLDTEAQELTTPHPQAKVGTPFFPQLRQHCRCSATDELLFCRRCSHHALFTPFLGVPVLA